MSTSKHTFDQVKSILGKLDRSIDDARAKRLDSNRPAAAPPPVAAPAPAPAAAPPMEPRGGTTFATARPLRATPNYNTSPPNLNARGGRPAF